MPLLNTSTKILLGNQEVTRAYLGGTEVYSPWTPAKLFTSGAVGAWYDPSDLSTLFQDSAGTTPVTGDGQKVALMKDKSGNDLHAVMETSANQPTYSNGRLVFGGSQNMVIPAAKYFSGTGNITAFAILTNTSVPTGTNTQSLLDDDNGTQRCSQIMVIQASAVTSIWFPTPGTNRRVTVDCSPGEITSIGVAYDTSGNNLLSLNTPGGVIEGTFAGESIQESAAKTLYIGCRKTGSQRFYGTIGAIVILAGTNKEAIVNLRHFYEG